MKKSLVIAGCVGMLLASALFVAVMSMAAEDRIILKDTDLRIVAAGEAVYASNCASCHGANLEGQSNWRSPGSDGRLPAPPHDNTGHTWHHDGDTLFRLTKYGTGALIGDPEYASDMPIYDGVLTDDEIIAVLSYIKSNWPQEIRERHDEMEQDHPG